MYGNTTEYNTDLMFYNYTKLLNTEILEITYYVIIYCIHFCICLCMLHCPCRDQRTTWRTWFSSSPMN